MIIWYSQSPLKYVDSILKVLLARCGSVSARTGMYFKRLMETFINLTVTAVNEFENVSVDLFLEIVGNVRGCQLNDFDLVTAKGEAKTLEVTFESVGGGTCLLINYGDSIPLVPHAFGDDLTCTTEYPHAIYSATPELDVALNFTHVYMWPAQVRLDNNTFAKIFELPVLN
ncbi:hypothetical protein E2C01_041409 [Portunus trituberculatus]|uniref:Uncharacterized protein n=1 Tax=Portunus trituberculatus TaxID=210409 RepID=A0A5B7FQC7_PORTR|nr:hypothetical protein [Portunus trituberculatus]